MKKIILLLLLALCLTGCGVKPKEFIGGGVSVTLTNKFKEYKNEKWDYYLEDKDIAFMSKRVNKNSTMGDITLNKFTLADYMAFVLTSAGLTDVTRHTVDGANGQFIYSYYSYYDNYIYMIMVMESTEYFYSINFCCDYEDFDVYKQTFLSYAMTVKVS